MCGIAGIYDGSGAGRADPELVDRMAQTLAHRGPDGKGLFSWPTASPQIALGVRRLSIIDLAGGDQPIFNEDRSIALVFNGEVYNHVELRSELERRGHVFRTHTDTETIVHLYEDSGMDLFARVRGMYAFALWDARAGRLILAVDPVGIKPLYLGERDGRLLFASEVKALLVDKDLPRRVNLPAVDTYLTFGYMIGTDTLYEGISRLAPGHALVMEGGRSRLIEHWKTVYPPASERPTDEREIVNEARDRLTDAVRLHLRSDVPLGLFLSGGIDSASLLALMTRLQGRPAETFSVGYKRSGSAPHPDDETLHAKRIASHYGAVHRELVLSAEDWWNALARYVYHHDEPNANPSAISMLALAEMTSRHVKVVLNGLGGDEIFCGYPSHRSLPRRLRQAEWLRRWAPKGVIRRFAEWPWAAVERALPRARRYRYISVPLSSIIELRSLFSPDPETLRRAMSYDGIASSAEQRAGLYGSELTAASRGEAHLERTFGEILRSASTDDPADRVQALWIRTWLPGNGLLSFDKVTMAHSLEARVPFFDPPLMSFAMRIPSDIRLKANKYVLREAMRDMVPASVLRRPKQPFGTPLRAWFDDDLAARVQAVLLDPRSLGRGWFKPAALEDLVGRHFRGQADHTELIFRLLLFELWQQSTIDAAPCQPGLPAVGAP
jgi:asparagine synthase (glutamine-hydrolysing)